MSEEKRERCAKEAAKIEKAGGDVIEYLRSQGYIYTTEAVWQNMQKYILKRKGSEITKGRKLIPAYEEKRVSHSRQQMIQLAEETIAAMKTGIDPIEFLEGKGYKSPRSAWSNIRRIYAIEHPDEEIPELERKRGKKIQTFSPDAPDKHNPEFMDEDKDDDEDFEEESGYVRYDPTDPDYLGDESNLQPEPTAPEQSLKEEPEQSNDPDHGNSIETPEEPPKLRGRPSNKKRKEIAMQKSRIKEQKARVKQDITGGYTDPHMAAEQVEKMYGMIKQEDRPIIHCIPPKTSEIQETEDQMKKDYQKVNAFTRMMSKMKVKEVETDLGSFRREGDGISFHRADNDKDYNNRLQMSPDGWRQLKSEIDEVLEILDAI